MPSKPKAKGLSGGGAIAPIAVAPAAFSDLAAKINELVANANASNLTVGTSTISEGDVLQLVAGDFGKMLTTGKPSAPVPDSPTPSGDGGGGGGASYSTYTFTACVNGTPKSFDIPIASGPY